MEYWVSFKDLGNDLAFIHPPDWSGWVFWTVKNKARLETCLEGEKELATGLDSTRTKARKPLNTINLFIFYWSNAYSNGWIIFKSKWLGCIISIAIFYVHDALIGRFCFFKTCFYKPYCNFCNKVRAQDHRHKNSQIAIWIFKRENSSLLYCPWLWFQSWSRYSRVCHLWLPECLHCTPDELPV